MIYHGEIDRMRKLAKELLFNYDEIDGAIEWYGDNVNKEIAKILKDGPFEKMDIIDTVNAMIVYNESYAIFNLILDLFSFCGINASVLEINKPGIVISLTNYIDKKYGDTKDPLSKYTEIHNTLYRETQQFAYAPIKYVCITGCWHEDLWDAMIKSMNDGIIFGGYSESKRNIDIKLFPSKNFDTLLNLINILCKFI